MRLGREWTVWDNSPLLVPLLSLDSPRAYEMILQYMEEREEKEEKKERGRPGHVSQSNLLCAIFKRHFWIVPK